MKTYDEILTEIKTQMAVSNLDTSEGSYCDTTARAVAYLVANDYFDQEALKSIAFVDETSGPYIDKKANLFGIYRTEGQKATATVTFSGTAGTVVALGAGLQTADGLLFFTTESVTIGSDGTATANIEAEKIGTAYNGEVVTITVNNIGVAVASATGASGGTDEETDASLLSRLEDTWQKPATSGNAYHYEAWALSVDGVGAVKVYPAWDGGGTVKLVIVDDDRQPPTDDLVTAVYDYVETQRPICVDVTVVGATAVTLDFVAEVVLSSSTTAETVLATWQTLLTEYIQSLAFADEPLVYSRALYMLLSIDGVTDYTTMTINDGTVNIAFDDDEVPALGDVEVTE